MNKNNMTLSVIMPNYNDSRYISIALRAIINQSYMAKEIIIIDDGSTDNSIEIIQEFAKKHPTIKLIRNECNMGVVYSANTAIKYVTSEYIYFASANDMVLPEFFEKSMGLLERYPNAGICCSDPAILADSGLVIGRSLYWAKESCFLSPEKLINLLNWDRSIWGFSVIIKRAAYEEAGGHYHDLKWSCDWFTDYVVAFRHGICYVPDSLATMRIHEITWSSSIKNPVTQHEINMYIIKLLKSHAYSDVLPWFRRSVVLSYLPGMLFTLLYNTKNWNLISLKLVPRLILVAIRHFLSELSPLMLKQFYRRLRYKTTSVPTFAD
jgi:glycosyltransferase involved in cell wall biosynthesis